MLIKYNPNSWLHFDPFAAPDFGSSFRGLDTLRREMDRLFNGFEKSFTGLGNEASGYPQFRMEDGGSEFVVRGELPGLSEKDVEVTVTGDTLVLKGERGVEAPQGYSAHRQERSSYSVVRAFRLPAPVDADRVEASLKQGVLTIRLPKAAEAQPRTISVKSQ